jgi:hypothetical protein
MGRIYSKVVKAVTSRASVYGQSSGSVTVVNTNREFGDANLYTVFSFGLTSDVTLPSGVTDPDGALSGTAVICGGVLMDYNTDEQLSSEIITFQVQSVARRLSKKSINTELFNTSGATVMNAVLQYYLGVPASFYDLTGMGSTVVYGVISGNSAIAECKKIAQASRCIMFEDNDGTIRVDAWKDSNSPVDVAIPKEAIMSVQKTTSTDLAGIPSRITVRGRYVEKSFLDARVISIESDTREPAPHRSPDRQGVRERTVAVPVRAARVQTRVSNLNTKGNNARFSKTTVLDIITESGPASSISSFAGIADPEDFVKLQPVGRVEFSIPKFDGWEWQPDNYVITLQVEAQPVEEEEQSDPSLVQRNLQDNVADAQNRQDETADLLTGRGRRHATGKVKSNSKAADEKDPLRIEVSIVDPDLFALVGDVDEEIDNQYIASYETLFDVAIRRFHEIKTGMLKWSVKSVYMPGVSLNDVVQFVNPENSETITGVVEEISIPSYRPGEPRCEMQMTVADLRLIGSTDYVGGSLLFHGDLVGASGNFWQVNDYVRMYEGFTVFFAGGILSQTIDFEVGADYELSILFSDGTAVLSAGSDTTNGTGVVQLNFTPGVSTLLVSVSSTTGGYLKAMTLYKSVTR